MKRTQLVGMAMAVILTWPLMAVGQSPKTRAEASGFVETGRLEDVLAFFRSLQTQSDLVRVTTFGVTEEGRAMPLVILADPPLLEPRDAVILGKPVVFIMANIHAGEVEGKEATQVIARRIALGDLRPLLDKVTVLMAPIYNVDGNEAIDVANRTAQYGPIGGVGLRENAKGLDLNRDFMKLDSAEAKALIRLLNAWDPIITVDLHTTNGSHHGYHLTYSIALNPSADPRIEAFSRDTMMPAIAGKMLDSHAFRTYYYGNFSGRAPKAGEPETRTWNAFTHQPRIGQNYVGLRHRLSILSEAYSYLSFDRRVAVTEAFVAEILAYAAAQGTTITRLLRDIDLDTMRRGAGAAPWDLGVAFEPLPLPQPVDLLVGEVTKVKNPRNDKEMTAMREDVFTAVKMQDFGRFKVKRSVSAPRAYVFKREPGTAAATAKLLEHGIVVEELTAPATLAVERFVVEASTRSPRAFQGHHETRWTGRFEKAEVEFPIGSVVVRSAQRLGILASYLLEPESDDGLVTWNFLDGYGEPGTEFPICKWRGEAKLVTRPLSP